MLGLTIIYEIVNVIQTPLLYMFHNTRDTLLHHLSLVLLEDILIHRITYIRKSRSVIRAVTQLSQGLTHFC